MNAPERLPLAIGTEAFLGAIWPVLSTDERICVVAPKNDTPKPSFEHRWLSSVPEAARLAAAFDAEGRDAYFGVGTYIASQDLTTYSGRTRANTRRIQVFMLDMDCGPTKPYPIQKAAATALDTLRAACALPTPILISSGNGLHAYWLLKSAVDITEWRPVAEALKALCDEHGLAADPSVTADPARILRIVGTHNFKDRAAAKPVKLLWPTLPEKLSAMDRISFEDFKRKVETALSSSHPSLPVMPKAIRATASNIMDAVLSSGPRMPWNAQLCTEFLGALPAPQTYELWQPCLAALAGWARTGNGDADEARELARTFSCGELHDRDPGQMNYESAEFDRQWASAWQRAGDSDAPRTGYSTLRQRAQGGGWREATSPALASAQQADVGPLGEFHRRFCVVKVGGNPQIFDKHSESSQEGVLAGSMTPSAFFNLYANITVPQRGGKPAPVARLWFHDPARRTYDKLVFDPKNKHDSATEYNLWRGLVIAPATGTCDRILEHIREVWCSGIQAEYDYVLRWLGHLVQRPWEKPEVALVLRSVEGTGKGMIADTLLSLFGIHGFTAQHSEQVVGRFNGHLLDKVLVVLEEAYFAGSEASNAAAKVLITNPTIGYESKGRDAITRPSHHHVIMLTNKAWAIPASADARRYMVLSVSPDKKGNLAYFDDLATETRTNEGRAAFLHHLLNVDLKDWNPRRIPATVGLESQKWETLQRNDIPGSWIARLLEEGHIDGGGTAPMPWQPGMPVPADTLRTSYRRFAEFNPRAPIWDQAARRMKELIPAMTKSRPRAGPNAGTARQWVYLLPDLAAARATFTAATGVDPCSH